MTTATVKKDDLGLLIKSAKAIGAKSVTINLDGSDLVAVAFALHSKSWNVSCDIHENFHRACEEHGNGCASHRADTPRAMNLRFEILDPPTRMATIHAPIARLDREVKRKIKNENGLPIRPQPKTVDLWRLSQ